LGMKQAKRPASPNYPLGYGKAIYFWSFLVAVMLFTVGGVFSIVEGIHKLSHPEKLTQWWWAVGVLAFSIVAEGVSTRAALQEATLERRGRSLWRWFRESRQAELIVIVGENIAALLGLVVALAAIVLTVMTGNPFWDAVGTIVIGALLVVIAVFVAIEIKALLIGQSMDPAAQARMHQFLEDRPEIGSVIHLITLQLGNDVMVSIQAEMHEAESAVALVTRINEIERALKLEFPEVRWSFFEPDFRKA
jgi:cation diffusion facilitator family transporter